MRLHSGLCEHRQRVCTQSWLWEKKSLAAPGNRTCVNGMAVRCSINWTTSPPKPHIWSHSHIIYYIIYMILTAIIIIFIIENVLNVNLSHVPKTSQTSHVTTSHVCFSLFIIRGHSTREPASSRVTYFILRANTGKDWERFWKKCRWMERKGRNKEGRNPWH